MACAMDSEILPWGTPYLCFYGMGTAEQMGKSDSMIILFNYSFMLRIVDLIIHPPPSGIDSTSSNELSRTLRIWPLSLPM